MTDRIAAFNDNRARLYGIAYRMLGTRADAEDMVQEAYLRWHRADIERIQVPQAWLVTAITHLCIDRLRVARTERRPTSDPGYPSRSPAKQLRRPMPGASWHRICRWRFSSFSIAWRRRSARRSCCTTSSRASTPTSPASSARARRPAGRSCIAPVSACAGTGLVSRSAKGAQPPARAVPRRPALGEPGDAALAPGAGRHVDVRRRRQGEGGAQGRAWLGAGVEVRARHLAPLPDPVDLPGPHDQRRSRPGRVQRRASGLGADDRDRWRACPGRLLRRQSGQAEGHRQPGTERRFDMKVFVTGATGVIGLRAKRTTAAEGGP